VTVSITAIHSTCFVTATAAAAGLDDNHHFWGGVNEFVPMFFYRTVDCSAEQCSAELSLSLSLSLSLLLLEWGW
jgi:hypothetical protein